MFAVVFVPHFFWEIFLLHLGDGLVRAQVTILRHVSSQQGGEGTAGTAVAGHILAVLAIIFCFLLEYRIGSVFSFRAGNRQIQLFSV